MKAKRSAPRSGISGSGCEVSVIQAFADKIVGLLKVRDPLSERVHLSALELLALQPRRHRRRDGPPRGGPAARVQTGGRRMTSETAAANANYGSIRVRQLVLRRDAHPAARAARGDVRDLHVLPAGRRYRGFRRPARPSGWPRSQQWRDDIDALYQGQPPARLQRLRRRRCSASASSARISSPSSTAWRWTCRRISARRTGHARSLLRSRRQRGRAAVGAGVRHRRGGRHPAGASSRPRAAAHQHPARHRRGRRHRPALSAARRPAAGRHHLDRSGRR